MKARLKSLLDNALRRFLVLRAKRLRIASQGGPCLILAPHPDDETLGCGGLILKLRETGRRVVVVIAGDGGGCQLARYRDRAEVVALRRDESIAACAELGVTGGDLIFLGFPDGELLPRSAELASRLSSLVKTVKPTSVVAPYQDDDHPDHRGLALAVQDLVSSGLLHSHIFEYPIWLPTKQGLRLASSRRFQASLRTIPLASGAVRKRAAIACYRSQMPVWKGLPIAGALSDEFIALFVTNDEIFFGVGSVI